MAGGLRQYGVSAPSSLTPVHHPEDVQPNEQGSKRTQRPPTIVNRYPVARMSTGGYRRPEERGRPFTQYATRGNPAWRRNQGQSRPVQGEIATNHHYGTSSGRNNAAGSAWNMPIVIDSTPKPISAPLPKPPLVHWPKQPGALEALASSSKTSNAPVKCVKKPARYRMRTPSPELVFPRSPSPPFPEALSAPKAHSPPRNRSYHSRPESKPKPTSVRLTKPAPVHWSKEPGALEALASSSKTSIAPVKCVKKPTQDRMRTPPALSWSLIPSPPFPEALSAPKAHSPPRNHSYHSRPESKPKPTSVRLTKPAPVHWSKEPGALEALASSSKTSIAPVKCVKKPTQDQMRTPPALSWSLIPSPPYPEALPTASKAHIAPHGRPYQPETASRHLDGRKRSLTPGADEPPPVDDWRFRSRSPSPKLPPTPLTRLKLIDDEWRPSQSTIEPSIPLPGRKPTPIQALHMIKKEKAKALGTLPMAVEPTSRPILPFPKKMHGQDATAIVKREALHPPPIDDKLSASLWPTAPTPKKKRPRLENDQEAKSGRDNRATTSKTPEANAIMYHTASPESSPHIPLAKRMRPQLRVKEEKPSTPVKTEPFTSPVKPDRKLITESVKFYPMPDSCRKSNPDYTHNRRAFFQANMRELMKLGLKKTKAFWRDDGLVIEWSSSLPVWSDTLKPDASDLASVIQRAYELNDLHTPRRSPKRKRDETKTVPVVNAVEVDGDSDIVELPAPKKKKESPTKLKQKHWADGIPKQDIAKYATMGDAAYSVRKYRDTAKTTMLLSGQPVVEETSSSAPKPMFTLPDPSAVPPSQEWRAAKQDMSSSRMVFKPTNPRKSQAVASVTRGANATPAPDAKQAQKDPTTGSVRVQSPVGACPPPVVRGRSHETTSVPPETLHLSHRVTTMGRSTPAPLKSRSPTLVNDSVTMPSPEILTRSSVDNVLGPVSDPTLAVVLEDIKAVDGHDLESVPHDLPLGTADPGDVSDDSDSVVDEETEHNVQEFVSKYATMFDSNRRNLKKAYAKDALFSCRVHDSRPGSVASLFIPESNDSSRSGQSRPSVSQYQFIPRGVPQTTMYTWTIPKHSGVHDSILLSVHGEVVNTAPEPAMDHRLTLDQTFLLRQRTECDDTDDNDGTDIPGETNVPRFWPFAIVSHHMTARPVPLLDVEDLAEQIDWIRDILH